MYRSRAVKPDGHLAVRVNDCGHVETAGELAHLFAGRQIVLHVNLAKRDFPFAEVSHCRGAIWAAWFGIDERFSHFAHTGRKAIDRSDNSGGGRLGGGRWARVGRAAMRIVSTAAAPKPAAAYSQAVEANGFIFTAGQVGVDPASGELAPDLEAQAEQVFRNLAVVLEAAGSDFEHVVKVNIYLADIQQFAAVNAIYERYVGTNRPARTTVGCGGLPRGALIEADVTAAVEP
jgi:2-iminobutanoate/2-iminopropanoate deaminase